MDLRICETRHILTYVKDVAKQKAKLEISEDELKKIFDRLLYANIDRPFEDDLIYEMASQIMSGGTVQEVAGNLKGGIIKKIIVDRNLTADDYMDVYSHLKNSAAIGSDILKFAQRTYNALSRNLFSHETADRKTSFQQF
ncbi:hypothetical protein RF11_02870 [Thelohanellus kitauei]|uniref:Uncharacterized protein n=1 Tax=Thelohanellus kitauei TaxID=669202 RepID=A0A0C2M0W5_THEKT|nr:hypothetical protein RF11_02870 [Thelohanellus kitauei]